MRSILLGSTWEGGTFSLWPSDSGWVVFTQAQFFSLNVNRVGQYPSRLQGSFFDNTTGLSGKSEAILNCNLDIFVTMNGVMGSMRFGLQRSNWITSSSETKGLWLKLTKQLSLVLYMDSMRILGRTDWISISQLDLLLTAL